MQNLFTDRADPILVAVGGPGGSGKSTFCASLQAKLADAAVLALDNYRTPRAERKERGIFGPHPEANDFSLLAEHLTSLQAGKAFEQPVYDLATGARNGTSLYEPRRFNLIDGETSTYPEFRHLMDLSVYLDADWPTLLETRMTRDIHERGYSPEKAVDTFLSSNLREFARYGAPTRASADILLHRRRNGHVEVREVAARLAGRTELTSEEPAADLSRPCCCGMCSLQRRR